MKKAKNLSSLNPRNKMKNEIVRLCSPSRLAYSFSFSISLQTEQALEKAFDAIVEPHEKTHGFTLNHSGNLNLPKLGVPSLRRWITNLLEQCGAIQLSPHLSQYIIPDYGEIDSHGLAQRIESITQFIDLLDGCDSYVFKTEDSSIKKLSCITKHIESKLDFLEHDLDFLEKAKSSPHRALKIQTSIGELLRLSDFSGIKVTSPIRERLNLLMQKSIAPVEKHIESIIKNVMGIKIMRSTVII